MGISSILGQILSMVNKGIPLPTNAKVFIESVIDKKKDPITNQDFSDEEILIIRDLVSSSLKPQVGNYGAYPPTPGTVNYQTYGHSLESEPKYFGMPLHKSANLSATSMFDPKSRVATTLGQFRYELDDKGDVKIKDTYDFDKGTIGDLYNEKGRNPALQALVSALSLGFGPAVAAGQRALPYGQGRGVNVSVPKGMFGDDYAKIVEALKKP